IERGGAVGGLFQTGAVGAVDEAGRGGAIGGADQAVLAVVSAGVGALGGHVAVGVVLVGSERRRGDGVRADAAGALRRIDVGADPRVGGHVADEVVLEGLAQVGDAAAGRAGSAGRRRVEAVGAGQAVEVVVAVDPALAGVRAAHAEDAAESVAVV